MSFVFYGKIVCGVIRPRGFDAAGFQHMPVQSLMSGRPVFVSDSYPACTYLSQLRRRYQLQPYSLGFRVLKRQPAS